MTEPDDVATQYCAAIAAVEPAGLGVDASLLIAPDVTGLEGQVP